MLYEFGSNLMTRNSLWQLGMDYLQFCSEEGLAALELCLTKIPIKTEKQATKILEICRKMNFPNAEQEICKVQAKQSLDDERYGNALEWAIRSKDTLYVTSIADFLLKVSRRFFEVFSFLMFFYCFSIMPKPVTCFARISLQILVPKCLSPQDWYSWLSISISINSIGNGIFCLPQSCW